MVSQIESSNESKYTLPEILSWESLLSMDCALCDFGETVRALEGGLEVHLWSRTSEEDRHLTSLPGMDEGERCRTLDLDLPQLLDEECRRGGE